MNSTDSLGKLVLRVSVGGLLLLHGVHKLLNGIDPIKQTIVAHGVPDWLAYGVYLGEVVGPILVLLGVFSRIGGALIALNMIVAVLVAGTGHLLALGPMGGYALELEAFYLSGAIAIILLGAGGFSLGGSHGRWN